MASQLPKITVNSKPDILNQFFDFLKKKGADVQKAGTNAVQSGVDAVGKFNNQVQDATHNLAPKTTFADPVTRPLAKSITDYGEGLTTPPDVAANDPRFGSDPSKGSLSYVVGNAMGYDIPGVSYLFDSLNMAKPFVKPAVIEQGQNVKRAAGATKQSVKDTIDAAAAQPGGLQAGFVKIPGKGDLPPINPNEPINTWSEYIRNPKTGNMVKNPNLKAGSAPPGAVQTPPEYPTTPQEEIALNKAKTSSTQETAPKLKEGEIPYPDVRLEPTDISTQRTGKHPFTGGNPVLVDLRNEANKNPYYLEDQANSRAVMDKYVPGNSAIEVENNLPKKIAEETKRIQNIIGNDPERIQMSDLIKQNESNMAGKGIKTSMTDKGEIATQGLIRDLNEQLSSGTNKVIPTEASGQELLKYKKLLDDRLQSVYKKIDNGTTLTPEENATLTFRRTVDQALTKMYPDTKLALQRQSAMIDARPSAAKAAGLEESGQTKAAIDLANQPKVGKLDKFGNLLKKPAFTIPAAVLGIEGGLNAKTLGDMGGQALTVAGEAGSDLFKNLPFIGGNSTSDTGKNPGKEGDVYNKGNHIGQTISYQFPNVKPNDDGSWTPDQKQEPSGGYMSEQQFQDATKGLTPGTPQYARVQQQYNDSQSKAQNSVGRKGDPVFDFMTGYTPSITGTNLMLTQGLPNLPTGFLNAWKPGLDIKKYTSDPKNPANLQSAMSSIAIQNDDFAAQYQRITGHNPNKDLTIQPGDSVGQMQIKLNKEANFLKGWYKNYEDPFLAVSTATGTANPVSNSAAINNVAQPQSDSGNVGFTHSRASSYLPQITVGR